jgi:hypothetical protein
VPEWPAPGTTIRIPAGATVPDGPPVLIPVPTTAPDPDAPITSDSATGTTIAADTGVGCGTYTVAVGDYPTRVATKLHTTADELAAVNENTAGYDAFYVGLTINVPC